MKRNLGLLLSACALLALSFASATATFAANCAPAWVSTQVYTTGNTASVSGINYVANFWTQNQNPATNNGGAGSGAPWTSQGACSFCSTLPGTPSGLAASSTTSNSTNLSWTAVGAPANCSITGYTIYKNGSLLTTVTGTTYTATCLTPSTAYTFAVAANDGAGAGARSGTINVTTTSGSAGPGCSAGGAAGKMIGYWESWGATHLVDAAAGFDIVEVAFAVSGGTDGATQSMPQMTETTSQVAADIATLHGQGKKVLLSLGGANTYTLKVQSSGDVTAFVNSIESIITQFPFDGIDLDIENNQLQLNAGDNNYAAPTTPSTTFMAQALNNLRNHYGANFMITMAPQTADIAGYGHWGTNAGIAWSEFLPLIYSVRGILTYVMPQEYNSGQMYGANGGIYTEATVDFNVSQTELLLHGFTLAAPSTQASFPALNQNQVAMGVPDTSAAAGGGYLAPSSVLAAIKYLTAGTADGGSYHLLGGPYPHMGGVMTWDCNYDLNSGHAMTNALVPYLHTLH